MFGLFDRGFFFATETKKPREKKIKDDLKLEEKPQRSPHHGPGMTRKQISAMNKAQKRGK